MMKACIWGLVFILRFSRVFHPSLSFCSQCIRPKAGNCLHKRRKVRRIKEKRISKMVCVDQSEASIPTNRLSDPRRTHLNSQSELSIQHGIRNSSHFSVIQGINHVSLDNHSRQVDGMHVLLLPLLSVLSVKRRLDSSLLTNVSFQLRVIRFASSFSPFNSQCQEGIRHFSFDNPFLQIGRERFSSLPSLCFLAVEISGLRKCPLTTAFLIPEA